MSALEEILQYNENFVASKEYESLRNNLNRTITIAVGKLAYPTIKTFAKQLQEVFPNLTIHTYYIRNSYSLKNSYFIFILILSIKFFTSFFKDFTYFIKIFI